MSVYTAAGPGENADGSRARIAGPALEWTGGLCSPQDSGAVR